MSHPLISIVMPTRGRSDLAAMALECAVAQDYPNKEIVIFDDADDPAFEREPKYTNTLIRYFHPPRFATLGDKRNAMCEESRGEIIVHFDSDDLSCPQRLTDHVYGLSMGMVHGFHTLPFYDISTGSAYLYHLSTAYVCGATLAYWKYFWQSHPFRSLDLAEDAPYTIDNRQYRVSSDGRQLMVALLHDGSTSSREQVRRHPECFPKISAQSMPQWFQEKLAEKMVISL